MGLRLLSPLVGILLPVFSLALVAVVLVPAAALANPYQTLNGTWTGGGTVTPLKGVSEKVACNIAYETEGERVRQTVRCAGANHKFVAILEFACEAGRIDGAWREELRGASGALSGTANGSSIRARLSGQTFTGRMRIDVDGAMHTIEIVQRDEGSGAYRPVASIAMHR